MLSAYVTHHLHEMLIDSLVFLTDSHAFQTLSDSSEYILMLDICIGKLYCSALTSVAPSSLVTEWLIVSTK